MSTPVDPVKSETRELLARLIKATFLRNASEGEVAQYAQSLESGKSIAEVLETMLLSKERREAEQSIARNKQLKELVWAWPGSFGSPIVNPAEIRNNGSDDTELVDITGIDIDRDAHIRTWKEWFAAEDGRWQAGASSNTRRYSSDNSMFGAVSARLLATALLGLRPKRYFEIGSGYSSAVALDVNDEFFADDPMRCVFIEPVPTRLNVIMRPRDRELHRIFEEKVQDIDVAVFDELEAGDVLFIDSSHVLKTGSDLYLEIFTILPRLKSGVFIHFHDIFYPFDYPSRWLKEQNRSWNEPYILRSFLMHNQAYAIHFWTDYFTLFCHDAMKETGTTALANTRPSSIWLRKQ